LTPASRSTVFNFCPEPADLNDQDVLGERDGAAGTPGLAASRGYSRAGYPIVLRLRLAVEVRSTKGRMGDVHRLT
jgi:hypothetical protein